MTTLLRSVLIPGLLLHVLAACSVLPERPAPPALHDFGPGPPAPRDWPWAVAEVTAPEWLQDPGIHYRLLYAQPTELRSYSRDRWVAPPAVLLAQRFNGGRRTGQARLRIELQTFEQVFDQPAQARVTLGFRAVAEGAGQGGQPAEQAFAFTLPTPTADAAGALQTFPRLLARAEAALRDWVLTRGVP